MLLQERSHYKKSVFARSFDPFLSFPCVFVAPVAQTPLSENSRSNGRELIPAEFPRPRRVVTTCGPRSSLDDGVGRPERFLPQSACFLAVGNAPCHDGRTGDASYEWGRALVGVGVRLIQFGIAAIILGFVLKSLGTQADPADVGLRAERPGISVFGTIHPKIFQYQAPIGSQLAVSRVRVASLDLQASFDAQRTLEDEPMPAWRKASFDERFASLGDLPASFGERFSLFDEHPAVFDESFASATPGPTNSVRLPPDGNPQKAAPPTGRLPKAPPIPVAAKRHVRPEQSQKVSVSPPDDGGRTAIYDITAHVVYLPNGQRLEAHSGLGSFMDNPRHVHLRMSGATPPNAYKL